MIPHSLRYQFYKPFGGYPNSWMVYTGKSPSEMDWWYPFLSLESPIENWWSNYHVAIDGSKFVSPQSGDHRLEIVSCLVWKPSTNIGVPNDLTYSHLQPYSQFSQRNLHCLLTIMLRALRSVPRRWDCDWQPPKKMRKTCGGRARPRRPLKHQFYKVVPPR